MEFNKINHGDKSLQVSNNCFIASQLMMKLSKFDEATEWLRKALEIIDIVILNPV